MERQRLESASDREEEASSFNACAAAARGPVPDHHPAAEWAALLPAVSRPAAVRRWKEERCWEARCWGRGPAVLVFAVARQGPPQEGRLLLTPSPAEDSST